MAADAWSIICPVARELGEIHLGVSSTHYTGNSFRVQLGTKPPLSPHISQKTVGTCETLHPRVVPSSKTSKFGAVVLDEEPGLLPSMICQLDPQKTVEIGVEG